MFKSLADKIQFPYWASDRYKKLEMLDRVLDGTLYDHLKEDFYTEEDHIGNYIPIQNRRPSINTGFAAQVVGTLCRKLFAGRHAPHFTHDNEQYAQALRAVVAQSSIFERMMTAMYLGSVGAVAMTFRIIDDNLRLDVWRAKHCTPLYDNIGDLSALRICYTTAGGALIASGMSVDNTGEPIKPADSYWFLREYTKEAEVNYAPISEDDWNPEEFGWGVLTPVSAVYHGLGFVPGVWISNIPGSDGVDGLSTFGQVVNNIIEMDYTMSQLGRGIRYSAAPQLVVVGDTMDADIQRGPTMVLRLKSAYADDGQKLGASDAKLLEMVGNGTQVGINYIQEIRRSTFEALSASIKKHELKGSMSGRAMEISDDAFYDLAQMFRDSYGGNGLVPLMSKIMIALSRLGILPFTMSEDEMTSFGLRWPKLYPSTPADDIQMVESLVMAVQNGLMDMEVAKSFLHSQMDLEDYRVPTPLQTGEIENSNAPEIREPSLTEGDPAPGGTIDPRRPGPQGHMLPRRRVGGKQQTID